MNILFLIGLLIFSKHPTTGSNLSITKLSSKKIHTGGVIYFPVNLSETLTYKSDFGETKSWMTKEDSVIVFHNESDDFKYRQKLLINNTGVYVIETYQRFKVFLFIHKEGTYTYEKPLLRIPFPIVEGQQWNWKGTEFSDGDTSTVWVKGKVIGLDSVTTEAGKFEAMKVESIIQTSDKTKNILTEWFAPGIGMVKMHLSIQGGGLMAFVRNLLGYSDINFELTKISFNNLSSSGQAGTAQ